MGDEGDFDPCECLWSNKFAMQRLLSILRQTQHYCTDNECFSVSRLPGPPAPPTSTFLVTCLIVAFAVLMYALGPKCLRQSGSDKSKSRSNGPGPNGDPPAPPPMSS